MVPLADPFDRMISAVLNQLNTTIRSTNRPGDLSGLLSFHILHKSQIGNSIDWNVFIPPSKWLDENDSDIYDAPKLAVFGILCFEQFRRIGKPQPEISIAFTKGIDRLGERQNVFSTPNSWILQPNVVIGIALGISASNNTSSARWLNGKLEEGFNRPDIPSFLRLCYGYGLYLVNSQLAERKNYVLPTMKPDSCTLAELALGIWLARHEYLLPSEHGVSNWLDDAQSAILERCLAEDLQYITDEKAAVILEVLYSYIHVRSQYPRLDLVTSLLLNFEPAMERWMSPWRIKDEYDIQSLLWLILRSHFDDLRYEEYLPKLGRSGHRFDIGITQLNLVVEAKYVRKASDFQKTVDEIGKDSAQLPTQLKFSGIFVFVYDESCSSEQHAWARQTIEGIRFVKRCVIVNAPSTSRKTLVGNEYKPAQKIRIGKEMQSRRNQ
ncbi:MAG: hypothetical protein HY327_04240 [Chloroflexi bacterium]|nr:hypothetical protein [Chloroflexota bacterium]